MKVLMATSETLPFSKSGGLADVVGALSFTLANRIDISIVMPLYGFINNDDFVLYKNFKIRLLNEDRNIEVYKKEVNKVTFYAIADPVFTSRKGIYGDTSFTPYPDNSYRFSIFAIASVALAKDLKIDILHCHDWTAGLIPYIAKEKGLKAKTIFTIHNLAYQGEYSKYDILLSNIRPSGELFSGTGEKKHLNMLKCGIGTANIISTVSPTYAKEIQKQELGCKLHELLSKRSKDLYGIINGIDLDEWNPEKDPNLSHNFSKTNMMGKSILKAELQKEMELEVNDSIPLIGMISRIAEQKGFYELLEGDNPLLKQIAKNLKCQFVIIGTGDSNLENKLLSIDKDCDNVAVRILFSNVIAHKVEAASDFFLMPSRYEPCGLNQLYSLRYGTLPIARKTGGLADSIIDIDENPEKGTGFLFEEMNRDSIMKAINRACAFYEQNKPEYNKAQKRAMEKDSSWDASATEYIKLYDYLLNGGGKDD